MKLEAAPRSQAGELALEIFRRTLEQVRGDVLIKKHVRLAGEVLQVDDNDYELSKFDRIVLAGAGKASAAMALGLEGVLGDRIDSGLIVTKYGHSEPLEKCRLVEAGHPVPDENSLRAGREMLALAESVTERDLVLYVLSGGASALMEAPMEGISLEDLKVVNECLLASGATIMTVNAVRSRLSRIKAGGLASAFGKASVVVLYLSDVERDRLSVIGSGPFVPSKDLPNLYEILRSYSLPALLPKHVVQQIEKVGDWPEPIAQSPHFMIGNMQTLGEQAVLIAREMGLDTPWYLTMRAEAKEYPGFLRQKHLIPGPGQSGEHHCLISVGETVVTKTGAGLGGRAQEMACVFAGRIEGRKDIAVLVAGSDGTDGPTDATGALIDGTTARRARENGFSVRRTLAENDSYHFHEAAGTLIKTGPTGTNLNDIVIVVKA